MKAALLLPLVLTIYAQNVVFQNGSAFREALADRIRNEVDRKLAAQFQKADNIFQSSADAADKEKGGKRHQSTSSNGKFSFIESNHNQNQRSKQRKDNNISKQTPINTYISVSETPTIKALDSWKIPSPPTPEISYIQSTIQQTSSNPYSSQSLVASSVSNQQWSTKDSNMASFQQTPSSMPSFYTIPIPLESLPSSLNQMVTQIPISKQTAIFSDSADSNLNNALSVATSSYPILNTNLVSVKPLDPIESGSYSHIPLSNVASTIQSFLSSSTIPPYPSSVQNIPSIDAGPGYPQGSDYSFSGHEIEPVNQIRRL